MSPVRLAIDVNSGDFGTHTLIEGVLEAQKKCPFPFIAYLCGNEIVIRKILRDLKQTKKIEKQDICIIHCSEEISDNEKPSKVWKLKKETSIVKCISLQKEGKVDASLSVGDTRILMGASIFILGCQDNISRPALGAFLPTTSERSILLLDVGANLNCRVEHLVGFGKIGFSYYKQFFSIDAPSVALLNIGHEPSKGTQTVVEAAKQLENARVNYSGFIEGAQVLSGNADVVVCDGFIGNVLLKACESFYKLTESVLKNKKRLNNKLIASMKILNPDNYGAVPLLGTKGIVLKAHGSSSSRAISHAIQTSVLAVQRQVLVVSTH